MVRDVIAVPLTVLRCVGRGHAVIRPIILAEVDDMAMLRLLAREREGVTLVPPIVVRDELQSGLLVEHCRIPQLTESFYAIVKNRRFPSFSAIF